MTIALCLAGLPSCARHGAGGNGSLAADAFTQHMGRNRYVVILPFLGDDDNPQLASKIRQSFYSHFSPKNYHDVEPREIDGMLDSLDGLPGQQWRRLSPQELGACFKADYLIYGKVLSTRRLFFVLYSQIALQVDIRMVEVSSGRTLWRTAIEKRMQSGDLPLHPLAILSAAVRTGVDAGDERMQDLIERTCRELASRVPEPADRYCRAATADIQIASFSSRERALKMAGQVKARGYRPRIEQVRINGADWHRVMIGPYSSEVAERARRELSVSLAAKPVLLYAR